MIDSNNLLEKQIDYEIVNRDILFKEDTVQKIYSTMGKIMSTSISNISSIKRPFVLLRKNTKDNVKRIDLNSKVQEAIEINRTRQRVLRKESFSQGYIAIGTILTIGIIIMTSIIVLGISEIMNW